MSRGGLSITVCWMRELACVRVLCSASRTLRAGGVWTLEEGMEG